jgi:hypothetical protein
MSTEGEKCLELILLDDSNYESWCISKCLELILLDDSNYESWCISILNNIEAFNSDLLSIVYSSICPTNISDRCSSSFVSQVKMKMSFKGPIVSRTTQCLQ